MPRVEFRIALATPSATATDDHVSQVIRRLRKCGYRIKTMRCPTDDPSGGGYRLEMSDQDFRRLSRIGFNVLG